MLEIGLQCRGSTEHWANAGVQHRLLPGDSGLTCEDRVGLSAGEQRGGWSSVRQGSPCAALGHSLVPR